MTLPEHVARGLYAAWRLTNYRSDGLKFIEPGGRGTLRSLMALAFCLPIYTLMVWLEQMNPRLPIAEVPLALLVGGYWLGWFIFGGLTLLLARMLDVPGMVTRFLTAYHWLRVYALVAMTPFFALSGLIDLATITEAVILTASLCLVISFKAYAARSLLGTNWIQAVLIALFDLTLFYLIESSLVAPFTRSL